MDEEMDGELRVPVMPISHTVLFPGAVVPVVVFEERYLALVDSVCKTGEMQFAVVFARESENLNLAMPQSRIGTIARIIQHRRSPRGEVSLMVQGTARVRIGRLVWEYPFPLAGAEIISEPDEAADPALRARLLDSFNLYLARCAGDIEGLRAKLAGLDSIGRIADLAVACMPAPPEERQKVLEALDHGKRAELAAAMAGRLLQEASRARSGPAVSGDQSRN